MHRMVKTCVLSALFVASGLLSTSPASADGFFTAELSGYEEVPAVSTRGNGWFAAWVDHDVIKFRLFYEKLKGEAQQAHIHFGQKKVNGGVSVFLCSNLVNAVTNTQPCPLKGGLIKGKITADDVIGPEDQGIERGELRELLKALKKGLTYVNVHTDRFPAGEIRGQIKDKGDRKDGKKRDGKDRHDRDRKDDRHAKKDGKKDRKDGKKHDRRKDHDRKDGRHRGNEGRGWWSWFD